MRSRQHLAQVRTATVDARAHGAHRDLECLGDLLVAEAHDVAQHDGGAVVLGKIAQGGLDNYRVLVLCDIHLLKRRDAEAIRGWVQRGGLLIADEAPSRDEGKQPLGVFESVFGVTGHADIADAPVTIPGTKAQLPGRRSYQQQGQTALVYSSPCGKGRATLLNFQLKDCYLDALVRQNADGAADAILDLLRKAAAGCPANVTSSTPGIEAALRQTAQGTTLLLLINHESKTETTTVTLPYLPAGGVVRDMVTGERLKPGPKRTLTLKCPWGGTRVLGLFPSDPKGLRLEGLGASYRPGTEVAYGLTVGGKSIRGNYLLDVSVTAPDGRRLQAFSALTCTEDATCRRRFRLPINAPAGKWTIHARSLWDGAEATGSFAVK